MRALLSSNPDYQTVTILRADWDQFRRDQIVQELNVNRRSTLVMFNNGQEVGRVVAQTSRDAIEALFQAALQ